jgi:hypothetical protein
MEKKVCTSCKKEKPVLAFHRYGRDGYRIGKWCEDCYTKKSASKPTESLKSSASQLK